MNSEQQANGNAENSQAKNDKISEAEALNAEQSNDVTVKKSNDGSAIKKFAFNFKDNPDLKNILLLVLFYVIQGWIVSCQFISGIVLLSVADYVNDKINPENEIKRFDVHKLAAIFGLINFVSSTQDIALDGWALDLLSRENVGWQAICNGVGFGAGIFIGNSGFLTFESASFCNQYLRPIFNLPPQKHGFITFRGFAYTYGLLCLAFSILTLIFKSEKNKKKLEESDISNNGLPGNSFKSIAKAYLLIWKIFRLAPIKKLIIIQLTLRIGFATSGAATLKLVEFGVAREKITLLSALLSPMLILVPFVFRRYMTGNKPLTFFSRAYCVILINVLIWSILVYFTPAFKNPIDNSFSYLFYLIYFAMSFFGGGTSFIMYMSLSSFFSQISDKEVGATYLTFIGMWSSIGRNWTGTLGLYLISFFTVKKCDLTLIKSNTTLFETKNNFTILAESAEKNKCSSTIHIRDCGKVGGSCVTTFDAYFLLTVIFVFLGFCWVIFGKRIFESLQDIPKDDWKVVSNKKSKKDLNATENAEIVNLENK